ncbi:hypothetical protein [Paraburkholderia sp. GAS42]|uniref:hypothetical protein n=1 Tax=Paraburkholderia sp. GAS42 TaxID=3035135 RepID=UPI003D233760
MDMAVLTQNVGSLPTDEREQNVLWYRLSKQAEKDVAVRDSHQSYLLFRDIAAMSLLLVVVAALLLYLIQNSGSAALWTGGVFLVQFVIAAVAARNCGVRFVQNVLVFHSVQKTAKGSRAASRSSSTDGSPRKTRAKSEPKSQENTATRGSERNGDTLL